ncbi:hypothetical protein lbkm_2971 [Lachnospiraceae bacterium KM106-2]|nr:hypothetical protein lbkm_2971 [Lachnospiraceae bacterium KM106-2]
MSRIVLNGEKMISEDLAYGYLAEKLDLPDSFDNSLDELWNLMIDVNIPMSIQIVNTEELLSNLGDLGEEFLQLFEDASAENDDLNVSIE